jgi:hypothetical protein
MAPLSADAGWQLGDAFSSAARPDDLPTLLDLVSDTGYGMARQMIVDSLWRFRKSPWYSGVRNQIEHVGDGTLMTEFLKLCC